MAIYIKKKNLFYIRFFKNLKFLNFNAYLGEFDDDENEDDGSCEIVMKVK